MKVLCILLVGLAALAAAEKVRYDNYKVIRVTPKTEEHVQVLKSLEKSGVSFWDGPNKPGHPSDLLLAPHEQMDLTEGFQNLGMPTEEFISDVQELMNKEEVRKPKAAGDLSWDAYYRLNDIYAWLAALSASDARKGNTELVTYGKSYEGRDLNVFVISKGLTHDRPIIFIEANIHAREWVTNAVTTYVINELLNGGLTSWLDTFDFHVVPVTNPDGYEFTHTTNRMWRKTRSPTGSSLGCRGADPNRNWGYRWNTGGSSPDPCSDSYMGGSAFSEVETKSLSEYYATVASRVRFYFAIHSYSQYILIPFGFQNKPQPDWTEFPEYAYYKEVSLRAVAALKQKYGTQYITGGITELLYEASGGSIDWIYGAHKTDNLKLVLAAELRDTGSYGFLLPAKLIVPSAIEFIDALEVYLNEVK